MHTIVWIIDDTTQVGKFAPRVVKVVIPVFAFVAAEFLAVMRFTALKAFILHP